MNLTQLSSFVRVAEMGSFSKAAIELDVPQPALSRQVRLLETDLRVTLLQRTGRGVLLTEAGRRLYEHALAILQLVAHARDEEPPMTEASVDEVLEALATNGLLSEARFVEARVRVRAAKHGNLRIRQELAQHGLRLEPDTAQALKDSEFERAKAVWMRKFPQPAGDAAARARQMRFLAGRGFSAEVMHRLLRDPDESV